MSVKTPTHILLNSDIKESSMQILKARGLSLSGFLESKLEELIVQSKNNPIKKPMKKIKLKPLGYTSKLTEAEKLNYENYPIAEANTNDQTAIQLGFSMRKRNNWL